MVRRTITVHMPHPVAPTGTVKSQRAGSCPAAVRQARRHPHNFFVPFYPHPSCSPPAQRSPAPLRASTASRHARARACLVQPYRAAVRAGYWRAPARRSRRAASCRAHCPRPCKPWRTPPCPDWWATRDPVRCTPEALRTQRQRAAAYSCLPPSTSHSSLLFPAGAPRLARPAPHPSGSSTSCAALTSAAPMRSTRCGWIRHACQYSGTSLYSCGARSTMLPSSSIGRHCSSGSMP